MQKRGILFVSGILNLTLLAVLAAKQLGTTSSVSEAETPPPKVLRQTRVETVTNEVPITTVQTVTNRFHWRQLESEDYFHYVGNLRAVGCPERTVQHIIIEDVEKLYREKDRQKQNEEEPIWITGPQRDALQQARHDREAALLEEKTQLLTALLGKEVSYEGHKLWVDEEDLGWVLSFLPGEKAELMIAIALRLATQLAATFDTSYSLSQEQVARAESIYAKILEELRRVATPGEIEEGFLRITLGTVFISGDGPQSLRLSGDELRRLLALQSKEQDPFKKFLNAVVGSDNRATIYSDEVIRETRQLLGEQRFSDYLLATDRELKLLGGDSEIPPAQVTVKVFEIQQAVLQEAEAIRARTDLNRAEKRAELKAIQEMSKTAVLELADKKGADAYLKRAQWWKELRNP